MSNDNDCPPACYLELASDEKQVILLEWPNLCVAVYTTKGYVPPVPYID